MGSLNDEHINYITRDLHYRGIVADNIEAELIDHVCAATEREMEKGTRFIDAYHLALRSFGHTAGLRETQQQVIQIRNQKSKGMFKNHFIIAFRTLRKQSFYSFVNVAGLSLGVAVCFIIMLFVLNEYHYDRHNVNGDRIYRVSSDIKFAGEQFNVLYTPPVMAETFLAEFPEVEAVVRFRERGSYLLKSNAENIKEDRVIWADKDFFKVFTVPVLAGDPATALAQPGSIAISKRVADKHFPNQDAIGQTLTMDNQWVGKITAVFENMPATSHFHFDVLIAMAGLDEAKGGIWFSNNFYTYLLLREDANPEQLESKFPALIKQYVMPQGAEILGLDFSEEKFKENGNHYRYKLQPLHDIHLRSSLTGEFEPNFDIAYIYMFMTIASFILIIACINFMNLSTARSANRAKEVGIRKVMGSIRSNLMKQFLTESIMLSVASFVLALGLAYTMLPFFNSLAGRELYIPFSDVRLYLAFFAGAVAIGVLSGIYPSFFLSGFKPAAVLKGNVAMGMKSSVLRSTLVVFQFTVSIFLVIGTLAIISQLNYIQNKKLGFNKDEVLMIDDVYALGDKSVSFKKMVLQNKDIVSGTISGFLPVSNTWRTNTPWWVEGKPAEQENMVSLQNWGIDYDYIKTLGMKIKLGRDFSPEYLSDSTGVILNEAAVEAFKFPGEIIGSRIASFGVDDKGQPDYTNPRILTVVGVVENFHFESLKEHVGPVMMYMADNSLGMASFRFQSQNTQEVVQFVESKWKELAPGQPFTYYFLDERFDAMYASESRLAKVFAVFTGLAIVIACLGLFALTAFTTEQRTREIGIRKVLGASAGNIILLLSKDFGKLILIAFLLAVPLAWYGIRWWLQEYSYKTQIGVGLYAGAGIIALLIAFLTMSLLSFKAATNNPVKSLRAE